MQAHMASFQAEAKKHNGGGGFDLYGGVFNNKIFGLNRADRALDRSQAWSGHNAGSYGSSAYSFSNEIAGRGGAVYSASSGKEPNRNLRPAKAGTEDGGIGKNVNSNGGLGLKGSTLSSDIRPVNVDFKEEKSDCKPENYPKTDGPQWGVNGSTDASLRNSSVSGSVALGRKSSDSSSCSSCGSASMKGTSPGRGSPIVGNLKVGGNHSGELSTGSLSGGSSTGGSPTAESKGRSSVVGNILGSGLARASNSAGGNGRDGNCNAGNSINARGPLAHGIITGGGKLAGGQARWTSNDCPPPLKSGYSSGSSGEQCSSSGNILPNGKIQGNGKGISKPDNVTGHVLGSGNGNYGHGSVIKGSGKAEVKGNIQIAGEYIMLKRALLSTNAEEVKNVGNDEYKKGHFAEALSLYERAISLSAGHASYHSNKGAALTGLGRLAEAVQECQQAIKLDPSYARAHQRLASLYIRLGEVENARAHFKLAGQHSDRRDIQKVQNVEMHLTKCAEARRFGDWRSVLRESNAAIGAGADSAAQIFASKAEALLKMHCLEEADAVLMSAPKLEVSTSMKCFGSVGNSYLLLVQAQVDMALGRFESAVAAAEKAARMDLNNQELIALLRKARTVAYARRTGNELFKACKFFEACTAYGEGIEYDPMNAVLLCNRAACRSKLGQWEKAVEDCSAALSIQPNYTKALLRRADCNAKLERWEESQRDYEALRREVPGDVEVARALFDVQVALKKSRGEEIYNMKFGGEVEVVSGSDQFRKAITAPGLAVVHFSTRSSERCRQIAPFVDQLCKRYPSVNFLEVDVEENLYLAKSENVDSVPTFKVYKNGVKVKEMIGPSQQVLEYSVNHYSI